MIKNVPINEIFTPTSDWKITDMSESSNSVVDGVYVIGRVSGQFFCPGGDSRNGRHYPESLWEKVLKNNEVSERLSARKMFGTIGHDEEPVSEMQLRKGEVSHIITKLWVDVGEDGKKRGMGEALILGTDSGKNLNTYLRAGCKLNTSSRASGRFLEGRESSNGLPIVDEDSYIFETFDFVQDPGFLEANPSIVEQLDKTINKKEPVVMDQLGNEVVNASLRTIMESRDALKTQLDLALVEKSSIESKLSDLTEKFEGLKKYADVAPKMESILGGVGDLDKLEVQCKSLGFENISHLMESLNNLTIEDIPYIAEGNISESIAKLRNFEENIAPDPDRAYTIANESKKLIESYSRLGTVDSIRKRLRTANSLKESLESVGDINEIKTALVEAKREIDAYLELGTRKEIEEALNSAYSLLKEYQKCGSPSRIMEVFSKTSDMVKFIERAGGKKNILNVFETLKKVKTQQKEQKLSSVSEKLSKIYSVPVTRVRNIVERVGIAETKKILSSVKKPAKATDSFNESSNVVRKRQSLVESMYGQAAKKL